MSSDCTNLTRQTLSMSESATRRTSGLERAKSPTPHGRTGRSVTYQIDQLARDIVIAGLAARVFGPFVAAGVRRAAAAGVRAGVNEIHRNHPVEGKKQ